MSYQGKLAILKNAPSNLASLEQLEHLAQTLEVPLLEQTSPQIFEFSFFLAWQENQLMLFDHASIKKKVGLSVDVMPRHGEQRSYPAPKENALAQAVGRKTHTIIDATTGWAQDSLALFRMGYSLQCIERSPILALLIEDGFRRLANQEWVRHLELSVPILINSDAIEFLTQLSTPPDCIYLDPMFPPKRKKSALSKKSMEILHELVGNDEDKNALFAAAFEATGKRVVVKNPNYAEPLGGKPTQCVTSKLLRYDVYLKSQ